MNESSRRRTDRLGRSAARALPGTRTVYWRGTGADERSYFSSVAFTRSHDRSIEAIAKALSDGAAVDSLVFDQLLQARPALRGVVRVIHRSPELGVSPVVASTRLSKERRDELRKALLELSNDPHPWTP